MTRGRAPGAAQEHARRVVLHLLGGGQFRVVAWVVALLLGIGWITDSLFEWIIDVETALAGGTVANWWPLHRLLSLAYFAIIMTWLGVLTRGAQRRYRPRVGTDPAPPPVRGLVLFLSQLKPQEEATLRDALDGLTDLAGFRACCGRLNWRMPLEAIAFHQPRLRHAVLICSRLGSAEQLGLFRALVRRVFPDAAFVLHDVAELDMRYGGGVPFDDVDAVSRATDDAVEFLLQQRLAITDVLIDVTGGQKTNAVAATAVALAEGRRIQYVAGNAETSEPYGVTVYDVTYDR